MVNESKIWQHLIRVLRDIRTGESDLDLSLDVGSGHSRFVELRPMNMPAKYSHSVGAVHSIGGAALRTG
jgi:hypothetical protein